MNIVHDSRSARRQAAVIIGSALVIGTLLRGWLVVQPPPRAILWDHHEYVIWSAQAVQDGVLSIYQELPFEGTLWLADAGWAVSPPVDWDGPQICNYPPLAAFVIWVQGKALQLFQDDFTSNTRAARFVFA